MHECDRFPGRAAGVNQCDVLKGVEWGEDVVAAEVELPEAAE
jgi:hypothetical protein